MVNNTNLQLTQEGYKALKLELEELNGKRPAAVDRLAFARSQGDLSENNDYHNAREALEFLDGRINELEFVLQNAQVVKSSGDHSIVGVGTKVKVASNGNQHVFHIVGEWEADPKAKKISQGSPLGQALLGKKIGDKVEVEAPAGKVVYQILAIE